MGKVDESLRWLGIGTSETLPMREKVYEELVRLAKRLKRPVRASEIGQAIGRHRNRVGAHLSTLRENGRAHNLATGWIPLK